MSKHDIGVIGMAVMGKNLALSLESRGYSVSIYNRTTEKAEAVIAENPDKNLNLETTLESLVESLEKPRKVILMVQAGKGTDAVIQQVLPFLDKGNILIDGGNTYFKDIVENYQTTKKHLYLRNEIQMFFTVISIQMFFEKGCDGLVCQSKG